VHEREITVHDLTLLQDWVRAEPFAPEGDWYKDFGSFKLCGSGEYPRTVLSRKMKGFGERIASVITSKPANDDHLKTGQWAWSRNTYLYLAAGG